MATLEDDAVREALVEALTSPRSVSSDAGSVTMPSVDELIKAANYLRGASGSRSGATGLRFLRTVPDGAVMGRGGMYAPFNRNPWT